MFRSDHSRRDRLALINQVKPWVSVRAGLTPLNAEFMSLHFAGWTGDLNLVKSLLSKGSNAGSQDPDGFTALHLAVFNMHVDVVEILIEAEPRIVDLSTKAGMIALHVAVVNNDVEIIKLLLKAGARPSDRYLNTPMHFAASAGNVNAINSLTKVNADLSPRNCEGLAPMHLAALSDRIDAIKLLKAAGADISVCDPNGRAPIHVAAFSGNVATVKVLIEEGIDIQVRDCSGKTPLHYVGGNSNFKPTAAVSETMSIDIGGGTSFGLTGLSETATALINAGADILCRDEDGCTPIFYAALNGRVEVIGILSGGRENVSSQDKQGATPICYAAVGGHVDVIKILTELGGSVKSRDHNGLTAMCYAACNGHVKAIEALHNAGASVSTRDQDGSTPVFYAAMNGHIGVIEALIARGANAMTQNLMGETPSNLAQTNAPNPSDVIAILGSELASPESSRGKMPESTRVSQTVVPTHSTARDSNVTKSARRVNENSHQRLDGVEREDVQWVAQIGALSVVPVNQQSPTSMVSMNLHNPITGWSDSLPVFSGQDRIHATAAQLSPVIYRPPLALIERNRLEDQEKIKTLENEINSLGLTCRTDFQKYQSHLGKLNDKIETLENGIRSLGLTRRAEFQKYQSHLGKLNDKIETLENEIKSLCLTRRTDESHLAQLNDTITVMKREVEIVTGQNCKLRDVIVEIGSDLTPRHDEGYYIDYFEEINRHIQEWMVRRDWSMTPEELPKGAAKKILKAFATLGKYCKESSELLAYKDSLRFCYRNDGRRVQMIRHILAAFLFDNILEPFVFGVPPQFSETFHDIVNNEGQG